MSACVARSSNARVEWTGRAQVTDVGEGGAIRCITAAPDGTLAVQRNPRRLEFFEPRTRSLFVMVTAHAAPMTVLHVASM